MATLLEDIRKQSDWLIRAFATDKLRLDYSIHSFIEIDRFFEKHAQNGRAVNGGRLAQNLGPTLFSIGAYVGETIIKKVPGAVWQTDDNDPQGEITAAIQFPDGSKIWPMQRMIKRFQNGSEDAVYVYGYEFTKDHIQEPFDQTFWKTISPDNKAEKPWWKFW